MSRNSLAAGATLGLALALTAASAAQNDPFLSSLAVRLRPQPRSFQFGLVGDQQYNPDQETRFAGVLRAMDAQPLSFVVHDGDIMSGDHPCSDDVYRSRLNLFNTSAHPFILTPGDNDWTDCHRPPKGRHDPIERLSALRRFFYSDPARSLGRRKLALTSQASQPGFAGYPENALWTMGNVVFATFHAIGSNNGFGRDAAGDREFRERNRANLQWISTAFALARRNQFRGIMLITQANPAFDLARNNPLRAGFNDTVDALEREARVFDGPVVLVHGDTHYFRIDKPLPGGARTETTAALRNFTRVETFGPPDLYWLRVRVTPANPNLFLFEPEVLN